jgi:hypothetical protein
MIAGTGTIVNSLYPGLQVQRCSGKDFPASAGSILEKVQNYRYSWPFLMMSKESPACSLKAADPWAVSSPLTYKRDVLEHLLKITTEMIGAK